MTRFIRSTAAVIVLLAAPFCAHADEPGSYQILLNRPSHVGAKCVYEAVEAHVLTTRTTWEDHDPTTTDVASGAHLIVEAECKEVDESGSTLVAEYTVQKCTAVKEKVETELLAPGTKFTVRVKDHDNEFLMDGKPASADVRNALRRFIQLAKGDELQMYYKVFGDNASRKVGESWPIDAEAASTHLRNVKLEVKPEDCTGTVTACALESINGETCVKVEAELDNAHVKVLDAPNKGMTPKDYSIHAHLTWVVPVDLKKRYLMSREAESTREFTWAGQQNGLSYEVVQTEQSEIHGRMLQK